jgi:putative membrane protein
VRSGTTAIDSGRALRTIVLAAWTTFFIYLSVTGEIRRYLGPRTYWVVPFGAIVLGAATIAHAVMLRRVDPSPRPSVRELFGHLALVAPLLAVLVVPAPVLGALAANKKSTGGALAGVSSVVPPDPSADREVSFLEIHWANGSKEFADAMGIFDGFDVSLVGFVSRSAETPEGAFDLTRFYVSCCAADAIPYSVAVVGGPDPALDTWMRVSGHLELRGSVFVLVAEDDVEVEEPKDPYLY